MRLHDDVDDGGVRKRNSSGGGVVDLAAAHELMTRTSGDSSVSRCCEAALEMMSSP